ncbi:hypothetical protein Ct61P_15365 [Colletotrichum tofieldiae]|nr:hypothetical protein Ct61P_15365 [Colletotrichum tofieldiae]
MNSKRARKLMGIVVAKRNWSENDILALEYTLRTFLRPLALENVHTATGHGPFNCYRMCLRFNQNALQIAREKSLQVMPWWAERLVTLVDRDAGVYSVIDGEEIKEYNMEGRQLNASSGSTR